MKKIIYILTVIVCLFVINGLLRSIIEIWQKKDLLISTQKQLVQVKEQNVLLKKKEKQIEDPAFFEEQARDKLFLVKSGEKLVLIPSSMATSASFPRPQEAQKRPIYLQWVDLMFKGRGE